MLRRMYEDKGERKYGKVGTWAELSDGQKHHKIAPRRHFIREWKSSAYSEPVSKLNQDKEDEDWLMSLANAQVHPTVGSHDSIMAVPIVALSSVMHMMDLLVSAKIVSVDHPVADNMPTGVHDVVST